MEFIIPMIALGGVFAISKKKKQNKKDAFVNMGRNTNYLPNVNVPPTNYPVDKVPTNSVNSYAGNSSATSKYFDQTNYETQANIAGAHQEKYQQTIPQIYSLTGEYINPGDFQHSNMVPFYRKKTATGAGLTNEDCVLDNMIGAGSTVIKKIEQAPLFNPQKNVNWINGMPVMSDFLLSRETPSTMISNVNPFLSETVAPGLNQGYGTQGSGGFNSGMEARELWLDKSVDDLRVVTNPKIEYTLDNLQGPQQAMVHNIGIQAPVEKNRPDRYFQNSSDRYLTTVTSEKMPMDRPEEMIKMQNRQSSMEYQGPASAAMKKSGYTSRNYMESKRMGDATLDVGISSAQGKGGFHGIEMNHKSHHNYTNNRSANSQPNALMNFGKTVGSVLAPIMDIIKPNNREELCSTHRVFGNGTYKVSSNYVPPPQNTAPTIKETTLYTPHSFQGGQYGGGAYTLPGEDYQKDTNRQTATITSMGNVSGTANSFAPMEYSANYRQTNNELKEPTTFSRLNHGNTQTFSTYTNVNIAKNEDDRLNNRMFVPSSMPQTHANKEMLGHTFLPNNESTITGDRLMPELLDAFKANPFTHSLSSVA